MRAAEIQQLRERVRALTTPIARARARSNSSAANWWDAFGVTIAAGAALAPMMGSGSLWLIGVFLSLALVVMGLVYGPLGAWLPSLFPARVRYTGSSIAFNVGGVIGGGLTPAIAQALATHGGLKLVGLYLAAAGAISLSSKALSGSNVTRLA